MRKQPIKQKEIYVRLYDKSLVDKYNEVKNKKRVKVTDNEFVTELIKVGLNILQASKDEAETLAENIAEQKRLTATLIKELRKAATENRQGREVVNKKLNFLATILPMMATGENVNMKEIESGLYDLAPERFIPKADAADDE